MDDLGKQFRYWDAMDGRSEIFSPEDSLPEDDLVFFLLELIPQLDLSAFYSFYSTDPRGQPPFSVPMMTTFFSPLPRLRNCLKTSAVPARHRLSRTTLKNQEKKMITRE